MAGHETDTGAPSVAHLITEQDVHAYVDGALPLGRRHAVEAYLSRRPAEVAAARAQLRATLGLRAARDEIYRDDALRAEVERLMAKRAAKPREDPAPACRASA